MAWAKEDIALEQIQITGQNSCIYLSARLGVWPKTDGSSIVINV